MTKITIILDETGFKNFKGVGFAIFDSKEDFTYLQKYIRKGEIANNYKFTKKYPHYTEDTVSMRNIFIKDLSKFNFKFYGYCWISTSKVIENIYEKKEVTDILKNILKKYNTIKDVEYEVIFEEGKKGDYSKIEKVLKENGVQYSTYISHKEDLFSCIPDYSLGIIKDYIYGIHNKGTKIVPYNEINLDLLSKKISYLRYDYDTRIIRYSFGKANDISYKEFKNQLKNSIKSISIAPSKRLVIMKRLLGLS